MSYPWVLSAISLLIQEPQGTQEASRICGPKPEFAAVGGQILDEKTKLPLQQAKISLVWQAVGERRARTKEIVADRDGRWGFCEAPPNTRVFIRAAYMDEEVRGETVQ